MHVWHRHMMPCTRSLIHWTPSERVANGRFHLNFGEPTCRRDTDQIGIRTTSRCAVLSRETHEYRKPRTALNHDWFHWILKAFHWQWLWWTTNKNADLVRSFGVTFGPVSQSLEGFTTPIWRDLQASRLQWNFLHFAGIIGAAYSLWQEGTSFRVKSSHVSFQVTYFFF